MFLKVIASTLTVKFTIWLALYFAVPSPITENGPQ
jgi:hypothetical protein